MRRNPRRTEAEALRQGPSPQEKALLDQELADDETTRNAEAPWSEVEPRLRRS